jgi:hypothetical protein
MYRTTLIGGNIKVIMVNNTFNNISATSWRARLLLFLVENFRVRLLIFLVVNFMVRLLLFLVVNFRVRLLLFLVVNFRKNFKK